MTGSGSRFEDARESLAGIDGSATILPLVAADGDRRLLFDWIEGTDGYEVADPDRPLSEVAFDLCIVDARAFEEHVDELQARKRAARPVILPYLLLLPEHDTAVVRADRGRLADNVLRDAVDEVISMPVKRDELKWRAEALLRLRAQSLRLQNRERKLRRFRRASEAAGHAIIITDAAGVVEYANPALEDVTGYDADEVVGEDAAFLTTGSGSPQRREDGRNPFRPGATGETEFVNRRKDGERYYAHQTVAPIGGHGDPDGFVAIQADITERVEAEEALRTFKEIVERIDDPIMYQDREGTFRVVNDAVAEYADMSRDELVGEDEYAFMDEATAEVIETKKERVMDEETPMEYQLSPSFPTKGDSTFSTLRYPHYDETGDLDGTVAICRNVTDLKERERQLQVIDRVLRHNLRNNVTVIEGLAELIADATTGTVASHAERIVAACDRLSSAADKERKITALLADQQANQAVDVVPVVRSACSAIREQYPDADLRTDLPDECVASATNAIYTAIEELLENAVTHSERDHPTVEVGVTATDDAVRVRVADEGPGIPEMERQVLTRDAQVEPLYHGSGLGLWLVNLIVRHSDGVLEFAEADGRGSVVVLRLPHA